MKGIAKLTSLVACALVAACSSSAKGGRDGAVTDGAADLAADLGADVPPADAEADASEAGAPDAADLEAPSPDARDGEVAASCPIWAGNRQFGTAKDDSVLALAATARGLVAGGYLGGTLGVTEIEPAGDARGFVRALSPTGETLWETAVDASGTETIEALAVDGADGVAAAGRTTGAFAGFVNKGEQDAFVAWLSPGGALGTVHQFGDERPQHPRRVALTPTGVAVAGFDDTYIPDNYVVDWENSFFATAEAAPAAAPAFHPDRTAASDVADGLAPDPLGSGDLFLSGVVREGAQRGLFVRRVGADGTTRWSSRLTTLGIEVPGPLVALADGTLWIAAAWFRATSTTDVALLHVDATTGARIGSVDFPSATAIEEVTALTRDARGDFWLAGSVSGLSFAGATWAGGFDAFVFHLAADGTFIDAWQGGTPGQDFATALAVDACGNVVVGGSTDGALIAGTPLLGGTDAFVRRVPLEVRK